MKAEIVKIDAPELGVIEKSKAEHIKATFEPMVKMLSEFEDDYNSLISESESGITQELTAKAKRLRIDIGKVRIATDKIRKEQKEEYLRAGKAIDGVSNILKWAVTGKENELKRIENHFEIMEQQRLERLQLERAQILQLYVENAFEMELSNMDDDVWAAYLAAKVQQYKDRIAAEKKAEEDRIAKEKAEAEERERMRVENERLRKEAEKREKLDAERRAKEEAERKQREEEARREREAHEAKLKAERDRAAKAEAELKAKEEAERKERAEEEARIQAELSKGDEAKVKDLIADLKALKTKYSFKSEKNKKTYASVCGLLDKVVGYIESK